MQVYVPTARKLYGSATIFVKTSTFDGGCQHYTRKKMSQTIYITKTHIKALDKPAQHCDQESKDANMSACIAGFLARQMGCNPMIYGSQFSTAPQCKTNAELMAFVNISKILEQADGNEIYELTGCLSPCKKDRYTVTSGPLITESVFYENRIENCQLHLDFVIEDNSYNEEEQYVIYDVNSFIADVGGYMGLLLGSSLLSLYISVEDYVKKVLGNARARKDKY